MQSPAQKTLPPALKQGLSQIIESIKANIDKYPIHNQGMKVVVSGDVTNLKFDAPFYSIFEQSSRLKAIFNNIQMDNHRQDLSFVSPPSPYDMNEYYIDVRYIQFTNGDLPRISSNYPPLCSNIQPTIKYIPPFGQMVIFLSKDGPKLAMLGYRLSNSSFQFYDVTQPMSASIGRTHSIICFPLTYPSSFTSQMEWPVGTQVFFASTPTERSKATISLATVEATPSQNSSLYKVKLADGTSCSVEPRFVAPNVSPYPFDAEAEKETEANYKTYDDIAKDIKVAESQTEDYTQAVVPELKEEEEEVKIAKPMIRTFRPLTQKPVVPKTFMAPQVMMQLANLQNQLGRTMTFNITEAGQRGVQKGIKNHPKQKLPGQIGATEQMPPNPYSGVGQ